MNQTPFRPACDDPPVDCLSLLEMTAIFFQEPQIVQRGEIVRINPNRQLVAVLRLLKSLGAVKEYPGPIETF
ncbi:MAG: hypothetical protein Q7T82_07835 [Armatimonadota bacterium]|nr:hypothetical protein [Armatimonadota bacterium]